MANNKFRSEQKGLFNDLIFGEANDATKNNHKKLRVRWLVYHLFLALLSIIVVVLLAVDTTGLISIYNAPYLQIDIAILAIFALDYVLGFIRASKKWSYFKDNLLVFISVTPILLVAASNPALSEYFLLVQVLSLVRLFKVFKFIFLVSSFKGRELAVSRFFKTNGFIYMLYLVFAVILTCSIFLSIVEGISLWDSIWLSFVTCATVGFGDIIPMTSAGRVVAIVLMLVGVGLIGTITSTLTTYFAARPEVGNRKLRPQALSLARQMSSLSDAQIETLTGIAKMMNEGNFEKLLQTRTENKETEDN